MFLFVHFVTFKYDNNMIFLSKKSVYSTIEEEKTWQHEDAQQLHDDHLAGQLEEEALLDEQLEDVEDNSCLHRGVFMLLTFSFLLLYLLKKIFFIIRLGNDDLNDNNSINPGCILIMSL